MFAALVLSLAVCQQPASQPSPEDQEAALYALVHHKANDPTTQSALIEALRNPDEDVRETARLLLVRYEPQLAISGADDEALVDVAYELARLLLQHSQAHRKGEVDRSALYWTTLTALTQWESPVVRREAQVALEAVARKY